MKKSINQSLLSYILNGISIFALLLTAFWLFAYSSISGQLSEANEERYSLTYNANRFMNGSAYLTNEVRAFAATGDQVHYDNYWNEINNLKNRDLGVAAMQEIGITDQEQAMIDEMSALSNALVPLEEEAMKEVQEGKNQAAIDYVYGEEYSTAIAKINELKEQFLNDLDARTKTEVERLLRKEEIIKVGMVTAMIIVAVIQIASMLITRWRVLRPVIAVRDQMGEISKGNLSADFSLESNTSEIGMLVESIHETKRELKTYINDIDFKLAQMAKGNMDLKIDKNYRGEFLPIQRAMDQILNALNISLAKIHVTARQVSEESNRLSSGAQVLSSGTVKQAAAVQELSASIQEISGQVDRTSRDAENARQCFAEAAGQLSICDQKMADLTSAIEDISKASNQIGGIIKTIEDISFQTNILALNAAVEAARAGEAGKGFAIVAGEVQNLANKSTASAKDIAELIENSMRLVNYGTTLSADTTEALTAAVSSSHRSTEMIERIADSALQQAESIRQIGQGMEQISEVVQINASTAEESAMSAEELQNRAGELQESIQQFQLRK